jgi:eukaryotic-like serine/threonine-protein kinase
MSNDTRLRAYQLFRAVLERPATERESLIGASAVTEPDVAAIAANMLRDYQKEEDTDLGAAVTLPDWAQDREGTVVNGWRVERQIDLGGFGRVYHAWRPVPGGKEEAAMKFLDVAPHQIARFLQERQVLVDLNDEGICKFIDAGTTESGTPYVAMEYVPGLPITRHCDYHRKTVTDRLNLFIKLCRAVEYAHDRQVLHRDLKPANILVTAVGAVRILDFGIAKVLDRCAR